MKTECEAIKEPDKVIVHLSSESNVKEGKPQNSLEESTAQPNANVSEEEWDVVDPDEVEECWKEDPEKSKDISAKQDSQNVAIKPLESTLAFSKLDSANQQQAHKLRLQQLLEPAEGVTVRNIDPILNIYSTTTYRKGGSWPINEDTEIKDLAEALDICIHIIEVEDFTEEQLKSLELKKDERLTGKFKPTINAQGSRRVYMVLSAGQYNPLLSTVPKFQGKSDHNIKSNLEKLIQENALIGLESHDIVRRLYYRQLEPEKHNNNCFYFALAECLIDQNMPDENGKNYTADSLKNILALQYKDFNNLRTQEWLKSIPDASIAKDLHGTWRLNYEVVASHSSTQAKVKDKEKLQEKETENKGQGMQKQLESRPSGALTKVSSNLQGAHDMKKSEDAVNTISEKGKMDKWFSNIRELIGDLRNNSERIKEIFIAEQTNPTPYEFKDGQPDAKAYKEGIYYKEADVERLIFALLKQQKIAVEKKDGIYRIARKKLSIFEVLSIVDQASRTQGIYHDNKLKKIFFNYLLEVAIADAGSEFLLPLHIPGHFIALSLHKEKDIHSIKIRIYDSLGRYFCDEVKNSIKIALEDAIKGYDYAAEFAKLKSSINQLQVQLSHYTGLLKLNMDDELVVKELERIIRIKTEEKEKQEGYIAKYQKLEGDKITIAINVEHAAISAIQMGKSNSYCGGYVAHLIANMANGVYDDWGDIKGNDQEQRNEDAQIISRFNPEQAHLFAIEARKKEEKKSSDDTVSTVGEAVKNIIGVTTKREDLERSLKELLSQSIYKGDDNRIREVIKDIALLFYNDRRPTNPMRCFFKDIEGVLMINLDGEFIYRDGAIDKFSDLYSELKKAYGIEQVESESEARRNKSKEPKKALKKKKKCSVSAANDNNVKVQQGATFDSISTLPLPQIELDIDESEWEELPNDGNKQSAQMPERVEADEATIRFVEALLQRSIKCWSDIDKTLGSIRPQRRKYKFPKALIGEVNKYYKKVFKQFSEPKYFEQIRAICNEELEITKSYKDENVEEIYNILLELANKYTEKGGLQEVEKCCLSIIKYSMQNAPKSYLSALKIMGNLWLKEKNYNKAAVYYQEIDKQGEQRESTTHLLKLHITLDIMLEYMQKDLRGIDYLSAIENIAYAYQKLIVEGKDLIERDFIPIKILEEILKKILSDITNGRLKDQPILDPLKRMEKVADLFFCQQEYREIILQNIIDYIAYLPSSNNAELNEYEKYIKTKLVNNSDPSLTQPKDMNSESYIEDLNIKEKMRELHRNIKNKKEATRLFNDGVISIIKDVINNTEKYLSPIFKIKYEYAIVVLGSMARRELCRYSDIELMIIVSAKLNKQDAIYFKALIELIKLPIIFLGASHPLTEYQKKEISCDSIYFPSIDQELNKSFLIGTAEELSSNLKRAKGELEDELSSNNRGDRASPFWTILLDAVLLLGGNDKLVDDYVMAIMDIAQTKCNQLIIDNIEQDIGKFSLSKDVLDKIKNKNPIIINVKEELLRYPSLLVSRLCIYYGLSVNDTDVKQSLSLSKIDKLVEYHYISNSVGCGLKEWLGFALKLRMKVHIYYGEEKDVVSCFTDRNTSEYALSSDEEMILRSLIENVIQPIYLEVEAWIQGIRLITLLQDGSPRRINKSGININARNSAKKTALMIVVEQDDMEKAEALLEHGAHISEDLEEKGSKRIKKLLEAKRKEYSDGSNFVPSECQLSKCRPEKVLALKYLINYRQFIERFHAEMKKINNYIEAADKEECEKIMLVSPVYEGMEGIKKIEALIKKCSSKNGSNIDENIKSVNYIAQKGKEYLEQANWFYEGAVNFDLGVVEAEWLESIKVLGNEIESESESEDILCLEFIDNNGKLYKLQLNKPVIDQFRDRDYNEKYKGITQRNVIRVSYEGQYFYIKELPEDPGIEYVVSSLSHRLFGYTTTTFSTLAKLIKEDETGVLRGKPVLISRAVMGPKLPQDYDIVLQDDIDKESQEFAFIKALLVRPRDENYRNFILLRTMHPKARQIKTRIFCVDNDQVFSKTLTIGKFIVEINFLSIILSNHSKILSQAADNTTILAQTITDKFKKLDLTEMFYEWLERLSVIDNRNHELFPDGKISNLFLFDNKKPAPVNIRISLREDTIPNIYYKLLRLQERLGQPYWRLLRDIDPEIAVNLKGIIQKASEEAKSKKTLFSVASKEDKMEVEYLPKILDQVKNKLDQSKSIVSARKRLKFEDFQEISKTLSKFTDEIKIVFINGISEENKKFSDNIFSLNTDPIQQAEYLNWIIAQLRMSSFRKECNRLNLSKCIVLDNKKLEEILTLVPKLLWLEIRNCTALQQGALDIISRKCKKLEILYLDNNKIDNNKASIFEIGDSSLSFPELIKLSIRNCKGLQIKHLMAIITRCPKIEQIQGLSNSYIDNGKVSIANNRGLIQAVKRGEEDNTRFWLKAGANVNARDQAGYTALMYASSNHNYKIIECLVSHRANVDLQDSTFSNTALIWFVKSYYPQTKECSEETHNKIIRLLTNANTIDKQNKHKNTALIWSVRMSNRNAVNYLLGHRANVDLLNQYNRTALATAIIYNSGQDQKIIKSLVIAHLIPQSKRVIDLEYKDFFGKTVVNLLDQSKLAEPINSEILLLLFCALESPRTKLRQTQVNYNVQGPKVVEKKAELTDYKEKQDIEHFISDYITTILAKGAINLEKERLVQYINGVKEIISSILDFYSDNIIALEWRMGVIDDWCDRKFNFNKGNI